MVDRTVLQPLGCKRSRGIASRSARHSQRAASRTVRQAAFPLRFSRKSVRSRHGCKRRDKIQSSKNLHEELAAQSANDKDFAKAIFYLTLSRLENKPMPSRVAASWYGFLEQAYTIYRVSRKPGLSSGYSLQNMSDDYAAMITEEFGGPVDVIGVSTGGSIAQHFAADHRDLVRRLVLHSAAHTLGAAGKAVQWRIGQLARQGHRRDVCTTMLGLILPPAGIKRSVGRLAVWIAGLMPPLILPKDLSDLVITIEAEDKHHFKDRLSEITAPTLVIAGDKDPFYLETLFRETAEGIPNARLILYQGMGHPASGKHFQQDVLAFLTKDSARPYSRDH